MILTTHLLSGAALGANVENPYAVAGLSVVLHFLFDTFPHGDYLNKKSRIREFWKVALDLVIGLSLVALANHFRIFAAGQSLNMTNIGIGIFFSLLPDGTTFLYWKMGMNFLKPVKKFHESLHCFANGAPEREFRLKNNIWDILISAAALAALFFSR